MPWRSRTTSTSGFGPFGFANDPKPFPLSTPKRPSGKPNAVVGYQPAGTNPRTWLCAWEISTIPTALASEQATNSFAPSALRPRPLGVDPRGWFGVRARLMVSSRDNSPDSEAPSTKTLFVLLAET